MDSSSQCSPCLASDREGRSVIKDLYSHGGFPPPPTSPNSWALHPASLSAPFITPAQSGHLFSLFQLSPSLSGKGAIVPGSDSATIVYLLLNPLVIEAGQFVG